MSVEITLEGLNFRQRVLADIIWSCDDRAAVDRFIKALPTKRLRNEAATIVDLMVLATVEQAYDGINDDVSGAKNLLAKISKKA
jgi:hypothetical protein